MDEISRAKEHVSLLLQNVELARASPLGRALAGRDDSIELDSIEVYFNRNPQGEQIDLQVGSNVFNLKLWSGAEHKLAEMLLLKGAALRDLELLSQLCSQVIQTRADNS